MYEVNQIESSLIVPLGTQVVLRTNIAALSGAGPILAGSVGEIVSTPSEGSPSYCMRGADGAIGHVRRQEFSILKQVKKGPVGQSARWQAEGDLNQYIIYQCVVGSQAYGLSREGSDVDRRGIYLPPADMHWSLYCVPEQLDRPESEECYWELQKFIGLALKANPNILECLFTPLVERCDEIAAALLEQRGIFLSKLVYQTYNGYVMSQFKKLEQDIRTKGEINWKHAMHLIRLLLQGISVLQEQQVPVRVTRYRDDLLAIRDGQTPWGEVNRWRLSLHQDFDKAFRETALPDAPDYAEANRLLIRARRQMVEVRVDS